MGFEAVLTRLRNPSPFVAFLPPALSTKDYFSLIIHRVAFKLAREYPPLYLVLLPPRHDYRDHETGVGLEDSIQTTYLRDLKADRRFAATVLVPIAPQNILRAVSNYLEHRRHPPLIIFDRQLSADDIKVLGQKGQSLATVAPKNREGGRMAADIVHAGLMTVRGEGRGGRCRVQIIPGTHAPERQDGFRDRWRELEETGGMKAELIIPTPEQIELHLPFDQDEARKFCAKTFSLRTELPDAFFCCNDEMALGVRAFLETMYRDGDGDPPIVVGFDGIPYVLQLIEEGDRFILGTVDNGVLDRLPDALVETIVRVVNFNEYNETRFPLAKASVQARIKDAMEKRGRSG